MNQAKRKISVSLDEDLVAELEAVGQSLSAQSSPSVLASVREQVG